MSVRPETIDEVIDALGGVIEEAHQRSSRVGYFAALYRKVTVRIRERIDAGGFDDPDRMERLDVIFANRYLDAVQARGRAKPTTHSWRLAFDVAEQRTPIVLQHLLLGMNAHINLDLGVAAAETAPGASLAGLKPDFDRINGILASLVGEVAEELAEIWTTFRVLDRFLGDVDTKIINFSMERARDQAWSVAEGLASLTEAERPARVDEVDRAVAEFGRVIRSPGPLLRIVTGIVRLGERGSVRRKIRILE